MAKESYAGKINRKFSRKRHVVEVAAGREPADLVLKNVPRGEAFNETELQVLDALFNYKYAREKYAPEKKAGYGITWKAGEAQKEVEQRNPDHEWKPNVTVDW